MNTHRTPAALLLFFVLFPVSAQWSSGGWGGGPERELAAQFDLDGNGRLNTLERSAARKHLENSGENRFSPNGESVGRPVLTSLRQDMEASLSEAVPPGTGLYDETVLRTFYLRFDARDWFDELADFYNTDVEVPADLVVDGNVYEDVGVGFRGSSSYRMTGDSLKKSFNISIDHADDDARLYGYRTLNLLNANGDPTFVREVLYSRIAREYIPAPEVNFVRLVVNGENWGLYVSVEQFNTDFVKKRFGETKGRRWKVPAGRGGAGLVYHGENRTAYERYYELKSREDPDAWNDLIGLSRILAETPSTELHGALEPVLDIEGTLMMLALETVFHDGDGYVSRGSDFVMYQDANGRFHLIPYDNNETFAHARAGGPNDWITDGDMLDPLSGLDSTNKPLLSRLLAVPELKARFLSHVNTIAERWLDWAVIGPIVHGYRELIESTVAADDKKLYGTDEFSSGFEGAGTGTLVYSSAPSLREFVDERRQYLESHQAPDTIP